MTPKLACTCAELGCALSTACDVINLNATRYESLISRQLNVTRYS